MNAHQSFRLNIEEKAALEVISKMEARKPGAMLRELIREGAQRRGIALAFSSDIKERLTKAKPAEMAVE